MAKNIHQGEIDDCPVKKVKSVSVLFRDVNNTVRGQAVLSKHRRRWRRGWRRKD